MVSLFNISQAVVSRNLLPQAGFQIGTLALQHLRTWLLRVKVLVTM